MRGPVFELSRSCSSFFFFFFFPVDLWSVADCAGVISVHRVEISLGGGLEDKCTGMYPTIASPKTRGHVLHKCYSLVSTHQIQ